MKYFFLPFLLLAFYTSNAQQEILDYCMIFQFDMEASDINKAAFQLPFMAGRSDNAPSEVKYYIFKINQPELKPTNSNARIITIKGVSNYQMESDISANEKAFFVCAFDPTKNQFAQFTSPMDIKNVFATFPSLNDEAVEDTYFFLAEKLILPEGFNTLTKGQMPAMQKGYYKLESIMIKNLR